MKAPRNKLCPQQRAIKKKLREDLQKITDEVAATQRLLNGFAEWLRDHARQLDVVIAELQPGERLATACGSRAHQVYRWAAEALSALESAEKAIHPSCVPYFLIESHRDELTQRVPS